MTGEKGRVWKAGLAALNKELYSHIYSCRKTLRRLLTFVQRRVLCSLSLAPPSWLISRPPLFLSRYSLLPFAVPCLAFPWSSASSFYAHNPRFSCSFRLAISPRSPNPVSLSLPAAFTFCPSRPFLFLLRPFLIQFSLMPIQARVFQSLFPGKRLAFLGTSCRTRCRTFSKELLSPKNRSNSPITEFGSCFNYRRTVTGLLRRKWRN